MYINKNFTIFLLKSFKVLNLVKHSKLFRNFCMSEETEKVYRKLEEIISVCGELKGNKMDSITLKLPDYLVSTAFPFHLI